MKTSVIAALCVAGIFGGIVARVEYPLRPTPVSSMPPVPPTSVDFLINHQNILKNIVGACQTDPSSFGGPLTNGISIQCQNASEAEVKISENNAFPSAKNTGPAVVNPFSNVSSGNKSNN